MVYISDSVTFQPFQQVFNCVLLGLQALHEITSSASYKLRVDLEDWKGNHAYAEYS